MKKDIEILNIDNIVGFEYSLDIRVDSDLHVCCCRIVDYKKIILSSDTKFNNFYKNLTEEEKEELDIEIIANIIDKLCYRVSLHSLIVSFNESLLYKLPNLYLKDSVILERIMVEVDEHLEYLIEQKIIPNDDKTRHTFITTCKKKIEKELENAYDNIINNKNFSK